MAWYYCSSLMWLENFFWRCLEVARMVHLYLTPRQADLVHWSLLLSKLDLQDWDERTGQNPFYSEGDIRIIVDKLLKSKRKAGLPGGGVLYV